MTRRGVGSRMAWLHDAAAKGAPVLPEAPSVPLPSTEPEHEQSEPFDFDEYRVSRLIASAFAETYGSSWIRDPQLKRRARLIAQDYVQGGEMLAKFRRHHQPLNRIAPMEYWP